MRGIQRGIRSHLIKSSRALAVARYCVINPATRNRTRDHLIAAAFYFQMLYQLSYSRLVVAKSVLVRLQ